MLDRFQHHDTRALAHDETIAILVIGARSARRVVVEFGRKRTQGRETGNRNAIDRRFRAAGHHDLRVSERYQSGSITNGVGAGRTGRHYRVVGSFEAECNRHDAGGKIDDAARNKERRNAARTSLLKSDGGLGDSFNAADTRPDQDPGRSLLIIALRVPTCIVKRLPCRAHRKDDELINLALLLRLHPLVGVVGRSAAIAARNHAGNLAGDIGHIKTFDLLGAAFAFEQPRPGCFYAAAKRRKHSHSCDDDTYHGRLRAKLLPLLRCAQPISHRRTKQLSSSVARAQLFAFFSRNLTASPTVRMVSAASSGISQPNSSSKAITSSTVSRLSAPRSSIKLAWSVTLSGSTPRCSTTIFLTRSPMSLIVPTSCFINWVASWAQIATIAVRPRRG